MVKRDIASAIDNLRKEVNNYGDINANEINNLKLEADWNAIKDVLAQMEKNFGNAETRQFLAENLSKLFEAFKSKVILLVFIQQNTK